MDVVAAAIEHQPTVTVSRSASEISPHYDTGLTVGTVRVLRFIRCLHYPGLSEDDRTLAM
jgi:hypothetical protein